MYQGSCLCGKVKIEFAGPIRRFHHCHCHTCRKAHATVYGSSALVRDAVFQVTSNADLLATYDSSPGKTRYFCSNCGSHMFAKCERDPEDVILRLGVLDGKLDIKAQSHIWTSHKADWYEIGDELPQFAEWQE